MNKFIKDQLLKVRLANLPSYDDTTTTIHIPLYEESHFTKVDADWEVDKRYLISVENYIIHPYDGFDLHINWNHNIVPKDKYMLVICEKIMGGMIFVSSVGYNENFTEQTGNTWSGWLPKKSITILQAI